MTVVFLTGGSGFVGSAVLAALLASGHTVHALARSEEAAAKLKEAGASQIIMGSTADRDVLREAAKKADCVINTALNHQLAFGVPGGAVKACEEDRDAVRAICDALVASSPKEGPPKVMLHTSGMLGVQGEDETSPDAENPNFPRHLSDQVVQSYADRGLLRAHVIRLSPVVHASGHENFFVSQQIRVAKDRGAVAYVADGNNVWNAVHVKDAAQVYVRALEGKAPNGSVLHAIQEEAVPLKDIAGVVSSKLGVEARSVSPQEAMEAYGFVGAVMCIGQKHTAHKTREWLDWKPREARLFQDMEGYNY